MTDQIDQAAVEADWTAEDAVRVVALPLWRMAVRNAYPETDWRDVAYANGTEADAALDDALLMLDHGPALRLVLEAGVRALVDDDEFQRFVVGLYSGDHDQLHDGEDAIRARFPGPVDG